jgi:hypothetical protein
MAVLIEEILTVEIVTESPPLSLILYHWNYYHLDYHYQNKITRLLTASSSILLPLPPL